MRNSYRLNRQRFIQIISKSEFLAKSPETAIAEAGPQGPKLCRPSGQTHFRRPSTISVLHVDALVVLFEQVRRFVGRRATRLYEAVRKAVHPARAEQRAVHEIASVGRSSVALSVAAVRSVEQRTAARLCLLLLLQLLVPGEHLVQS